MAGSSAAMIHAPDMMGNASATSRNYGKSAFFDSAPLACPEQAPEPDILVRTVTDWGGNFASWRLKESGKEKPAGEPAG